MKRTKKTPPAKGYESAATLTARCDRLVIERDKALARNALDSATINGLHIQIAKHQQYEATRDDHFKTLIGRADQQRDMLLALVRQRDAHDLEAQKLNAIAMNFLGRIASAQWASLNAIDCDHANAGKRIGPPLPGAFLWCPDCGALSVDGETFVAPTGGAK